MGRLAWPLGSLGWLPYDHPDLFLSGGACVAVLRTARAAADRPFRQLSDLGMQHRQVHRQPLLCGTHPSRFQAETPLIPRSDFLSQLSECPVESIPQVHA
jgi:hypothetical protein